MAQQPLPYGQSDNDPNPANSISNREGWKRTGEMFSDLYSLQSSITSAGDFAFSGELTDEEKIDAAIASALTDGDDIVFIPASLLPYNVTLLTNLAAFTAVGGKLVREGGDFSVYDIVAYGADWLGLTDSTTSIQAAIDSGKGDKIVVSFGTFLHAGVLLSGASYNDTTIECVGELKLRARVGSETTFAGAFLGLVFQDCDNIILYYRGHGNRLTQTDEHSTLVGLAGVTHFKSPTFYAREIRGDALYVSQSDWFANSTDSSDVSIGDCVVANSVDDGRNAISIISVDRMTIDSLTSNKVGGTIAGVPMPGGLDIEPNGTYHQVRGLVIHNLEVVSAGTSGLGIVGIAITNDATGDWNIHGITIGNAVVQLTGTSGFVSWGRAFDLRANVSISSSGTDKQGLALDFLDRPNITAVIRGPGITSGLILGTVGWVSDFSITADISTYSVLGIQAIGLRRGRLNGRVYGATTSSSTFAVRTRSSGRALTQSKVLYVVDTPFDGLNARAFRNEPGDEVIFSLCRWQDCDVTGYANFPACFQGLTAGLLKVNVAGVTEGTAAPGNGTWNVGDQVLNTNPSAGAGIGWVCVTAGSPGTWNRFGFVSLDGSATYDPPSLADGVGATTTVTVTGAALGDFATASFSLDLQGMSVTAWVSATNTVSVRFQNESGGLLDLASGTLRARVVKL